MQFRSSDLDDYVAWLEDRGRAASTVRQYRRQLARLLPLEDPAAPLLVRDHSPMYRHSIAAALRSWADYAADSALNERVRSIRIPSRLRRGNREPLGRDEWFQVLDEIEECDLDPACGAALFMIAVRGLRCGDVLRVSRKALLKARRTGILELVAKGERIQHVAVAPISVAVEELLALSWGDAETVAGLICPSSRRDCRHDSAARAIRRALKTIADEVGIDQSELYPHRFRHTYVHHFLSTMAGDPEALVKLQQQMGWARMDTASSYLRKARQEELDALESKLLSGRKKSRS